MPNVAAAPRSLFITTPVGSSRRDPAEPSLLERAERLRDGVLKSKLCHPDPWRYTPKARAWSQRAQQIVELIATEVDAAGHRRVFEALAAEVEGDLDFQEACRLF